MVGTCHHIIGSALWYKSYAERHGFWGHRLAAFHNAACGIACRYPSEFDADSYSFQGLFGYKVFVACGLIFGDGLYSLLKILYTVISRLRTAHGRKQQLQDEPEMSEAEFAEGWSPQPDPILL